MWGLCECRVQVSGVVEADLHVAVRVSGGARGGFLRLGDADVCEVDYEVHRLGVVEGCGVW